MKHMRETYSQHVEGKEISSSDLPQSEREGKNSENFVCIGLMLTVIFHAERMTLKFNKKNVFWGQPQFHVFSCVLLNP